MSKKRIETLEREVIYLKDEYAAQENILSSLRRGIDHTEYKFSSRGKSPIALLVGGALAAFFGFVTKDLIAAGSELSFFTALLVILIGLGTSILTVVLWLGWYD